MYKEYVSTTNRIYLIHIGDVAEVVAVASNGHVVESEGFEYGRDCIAYDQFRQSYEGGKNDNHYEKPTG